jgi:hypothetical protein
MQQQTVRRYACKTARLLATHFRPVAVCASRSRLPIWTLTPSRVRHTHDTRSLTLNRAPQYCPALGQMPAPAVARASWGKPSRFANSSALAKESRCSCSRSVHYLGLASLRRSLSTDVTDPPAGHRAVMCTSRCRGKRWATTKTSDATALCTLSSGSASVPQPLAAGDDHSYNVTPLSVLNPVEPTAPRWRRTGDSELPGPLQIRERIA